MMYDVPLISEPYKCFVEMYFSYTPKKSEQGSRIDLVIRAWNPEISGMRLHGTRPFKNPWNNGQPGEEKMKGEIDDFQTKFKLTNLWKYDTSFIMKLLTKNLELRYHRKHLKLHWSKAIIRKFLALGSWNREIDFSIFVLRTTTR